MKGNFLYATDGDVTAQERYTFQGGEGRNTAYMPLMEMFTHRKDPHPGARGYSLYANDGDVPT